MIEINLNFATEQTDRIVCIFQPSVAPRFPVFRCAFSVPSGAAQSEVAFPFIANGLDDTVVLLTNWDSCV